MSWNKFVEWVFKGVLAACALYGSQSLGKLQTNVAELNIKMAVIVEKYDWHSKWLERHDFQIDNLQKVNR